METYEVKQALMSVGTVYHVRKPGTEDVAYAVHGELMSTTPKFRLVPGEEGETLAQLTGNFLKTKYEVSKGGKVIAGLVFPAVAFKKTLTLTIDGKHYEADGGVFKGVFQCKGDDGKMVLEIAKTMSIRDSFVVKPGDTLDFEIGLLVAVAIHSRFYEMV